jgi:endo-alpha-1,4-polygalactosaminidase (GH114 family)
MDPLTSQNFLRFGLAEVRGIGLKTDDNGQVMPPLVRETTASDEVSRVRIPTNTTWALEAWADALGGDPTEGMKVVDIDLLGTTDDNDWGRTVTTKIRNLTANDHIVFCYISVGTLEPYRPDYKPKAAAWHEVMAHPDGGWSDEWYLDLTKIDQVKALMEPRFQLAEQYGCHGIEPDNIDCYDDSTCWKYQGGAGYPSPTRGNDSESQVKALSIEYNKWLIDQAHSRGMAIAIKNAPDLITALGADYDCAFVEQMEDDGTPSQW